MNFNWTISIGDVIKTLMIAAAFFAWGVTVETRFERQAGFNERMLLQAEMMDRRMDRTDQRISRTVEEIKDAILRLEKKLERNGQ